MYELCIVLYCIVSITLSYGIDDGLDEVCYMLYAIWYMDRVCCVVLCCVVLCSITLSYGINDGLNEVCSRSRGLFTAMITVVQHSMPESRRRKVMVMVKVTGF